MQRLVFHRQLIARRGAAAVEFSVAVTILVALVFAAVELASVSMIRHAVDTAAYEGARAAMVPGGTTAMANTEAQEVLQKAGIDGGTIVVTPATLNDESGRIEVEVTVPVDENGWVLAKFMRGRQLRSSVRLMTERDPAIMHNSLPTPPPPPPSEDPGTSGDDDGAGSTGDEPSEGGSTSEGGDDGSSESGDSSSGDDGGESPPPPPLL